MRYTSELNELQDAVLEAISTARDQIEIQFSNHAADESIVDYTLKRLFSYMSDRSQAVSYLVSSNYSWDAEIILRSFYEANAKIWFICVTAPERREELAKEFWGTFSAMHNYKRAHRASGAVEVAKRHQKSVDVAILANLANSKIFDFGESNKQERRALESKWSFTEIIRYLSENSPKDFDLQNTPGLLHMYGQQSHLIHADETALDLMLDRKRRAPVEKEILACAHVSRIFSDQVSLWTFSALALQYRYARQTEIGGGLVAKWDKVQKLTEPFNVRFNKSQKQFYDGFNNQ